jgi:hypothetical protein
VVFLVSRIGKGNSTELRLKLELERFKLELELGRFKLELELGRFELELELEQ